MISDELIYLFAAMFQHGFLIKIKWFCKHENIKFYLTQTKG